MERHSCSRVILAAGPLVLAVGCGAAFEAGRSEDAGAKASNGAMLDATLDGTGANVDASVDPVVSSLEWAQWPMPNTLDDVEAGAPNAESYTDNEDGTVTDNVTGLMWQQMPSDDAGVFPLFPWAGDSGASLASTYCAGLVLAGHDDWRVPTLIELVSLVNEDEANPSIDVAYFPNTPGAPFWSSTRAVSGPPNNEWCVSFDEGYTGYGDTTEAGWVRCVRQVGEAP